MDYFQLYLQGSHLVKFPVGVSWDPGGMASLPQQSGVVGSGFSGNTLLPVKPPLTLVSSSPDTWHFTLYLPFPVYLAKYLKQITDNEQQQKNNPEEENCF